MVRAGIVYSMLALGFFTLVIFSNQPASKNVHSRKHGPGRKIVIRHTYAANSSSNSTLHAAFDPIVADMEWRRENRDWERNFFDRYKAWDNNATADDHHQAANDVGGHFDQSHHAHGEEEQPTPWDSDFDDPEDYLNDEDHFNISNRLQTLFPLLDTNPTDGFLSLTELQEWHVQQAEKLAKQRVKQEFEVRDKNHDGLISIREYIPQFSDEELANGSNAHGEAGWWKEHFSLADVDGDGGLNLTEFADFLHPEDGHNPKLHQWMRKEQISENDHDKDGKLSLDEFDRIYDVMRYYGEDLSHLHQGGDIEARKEKFVELDKNKDGFLTEDELEPIMHRLQPGESYYAKQQAEYLIQQADEDKDGRLTLKEMLEHPYVFYSTAVTPEEWPSEYEHDEFR